MNYQRAKYSQDQVSYSNLKTIIYDFCRGSLDFLGIAGTISKFDIIKVGLKAYTMSRGEKKELMPKMKLLKMKFHELGLNNYTNPLEDIFHHQVGYGFCNYFL